MAIETQPLVSQGQIVSADLLLLTDGRTDTQLLLNFDMHVYNIMFAKFISTCNS